MLKLTNDMKELIELFNEYNVDYAVCGGYAVSYYGYMRATFDFDILINPNRENAEKVMIALTDFGFGNAGIDPEVFTKEGAAIHLGAEPNAIDIITSISTEKTAQYFNNIVEDVVDNLKIRILGMDELIEAKRLVNRTKDKLDVEELLALKQKQ